MTRESSRPTPGRALTQLVAQHDALRVLMDRCDELADALDAGRIAPERLTHEVARLRAELEVHNSFEEQLLRPVLIDEDPYATVRIDRMVEDHVGEHRAMGAQLNTEETRALRDALELLRAHLAAEERYLLNARVLHDDLVTVEGGG